MKIRVLVAVGSLLTIGTAVAGSFMYGHNLESVASSVCTRSLHRGDRRPHG